MAKVKYDVVAVTGTYQDPVTGQEKKKYVTCGRVIENDKGFSLKLDVVPINSEGWFGLYEPKKKNNKVLKIKLLAHEDFQLLVSAGSLCVFYPDAQLK